MISAQSSKSFPSTHSARFGTLHPSNCTLNSYKHPSPRCLASDSTLFLTIDVTWRRSPLTIVLPGVVVNSSSDELTCELTTILHDLEGVLGWVLRAVNHKTLDSVLHHVGNVILT